MSCILTSSFRVLWLLIWPRFICGIGSPREIRQGEEIAWYADGETVVRNEYNPSLAYAYGMYMQVWCLWIGFLSFTFVWLIWTVKLKYICLEFASIVLLRLNAHLYNIYFLRRKKHSCSSLGVIFLSEMEFHLVNLNIKICVKCEHRWWCETLILIGE